MSCKVLAPAEAPQDSPMVWRQVRGAAGGAEMPPVASEALARMERDCQRRVSEARQTALREGEAAGRERAAGELQAVIDRLGRSIEELASARGRLRREAEGDLVRLSIAIARRVLRREISIDPEALHGIVLAALEKLQARDACRVKVHPSQAAAVCSCLQRTEGARIEVTPDPACEPGAVVFETERGNLEAGVETQLREIERGLADRLRRKA